MIAFMVTLLAVLIFIPWYKYSRNFHYGLSKTTFLITANFRNLQLVIVLPFPLMKRPCDIHLIGVISGRAP